MKKIFAPFIAVIAVLCIASCSQKFNIAAPYKNITVIYGLLDQADTAHYIRIEKAFLDQNKSALTMAKVADSSYYAHLNVRIKRLLVADTTLFDTIHLTQVDLDNEGYPKQPGTFFTAPNLAYKFTNTLDPLHTYRIIVTNLATGEVDSANTIILSEDPAIFTCRFFDNPNQQFDFSSTLPNTVFSSFSFSYADPNNANAIAGIGQGVIRFNWVDSDITTHIRTPRYYDDNLGYQVTTSNFIYSKSHIDLYYDLANGMGVAPANVVRLIDRCDFFAYISTQDFANYYNNSQIQGTGLTGSEIEPLYTNIMGANALGIYTAKAGRTDRITLTTATVDSLIASPVMQQTLLVGTAY